MKKGVNELSAGALMIGIVLFCTALPGQGWAASFNTDRYAPVKLTQLQATPEEYKNDRVVFTTEYSGFEIRFPPYIERSGFKPEQDFYLRVLPVNLPVMAGKKDFADPITELPRGAGLRIYGKIKQFGSSPRDTRFPRYYLDLEHLELIPADALKQEIDNEGALKRPLDFRHRPRPFGGRGTR